MFRCRLPMRLDISNHLAEFNVLRIEMDDLDLRRFIHAIQSAQLIKRSKDFARSECPSLGVTIESWFEFRQESFQPHGHSLAVLDCIWRELVNQLRNPT